MNRPREVAAGRSGEANRDFKTEAREDGGVILHWTDGRGTARQLRLGRISPEMAENAVLHCQSDPWKSPKAVLRRAERLEECSGKWIERRAGTDAIFLGWYDALSRQTRHVSLRTSDPSLARRQLYRCADAEGEDPREVLARPPALTVSDLLDVYLKNRGSKLASAQQASIGCAHLRRIVGRRHCDLFSYDDSVKLSEALLAEGKSVAYASRILSVLRSAFNQGRKGKLVARVPDIHEPRTRAHMEAEPLKGDFLEIEQIAAFVDEAPEFHALTAIAFLVNTGARIGSILDLRHEQIDLATGLIRLNPEGRLQTNKRRATLKIPSTLRPWLARRHESEWLVARDGQRVKSIKTAIRGMRQRAGLPESVNTYSIRHTLARWMDRQRVPDKQVSIVLGHVPVSVKRTTLRYTEQPESPDYLREATASIEDFVRAIAARTRKVDLLRPPWDEPRPAHYEQRRGRGHTS